MKTLANCKINLGLNITERRPDGYHNIETIFYPIPLADELAVEEHDSDLLETSGIPVVCDPPKNLVVKVLYLLRKQGFNIPELKISLKKNVPNGAGLGGGSSDAAFMMKILNKKFHLGLTEEAMEESLSTLGADCPVFIKNKPVYAEGIGNIFKEISLDLSGWHLTLVKPDIFVPTRDAYAAVTPKRPETNLRQIIAQPVHTWKHSLRNDFEDSVFCKYPEIKEIKKQLYSLGAVYASMSGSGSCVFALSKEKLQLGISMEEHFTHQCML